MNHVNRLYKNFDFRAVLEDERNSTRLFPYLCAVYNNESFEYGGRLYCKPCRGISYQKLNKQERATIKINENTTVELDFVALHISMLYAMVKSAVPAAPYEILNE